MDALDMKDLFESLGSYVDAIDYLSIKLDDLSDTSTRKMEEYIALYVARKATIEKLRQLVRSYAT